MFKCVQINRYSFFGYLLLFSLIPSTSAHAGATLPHLGSKTVSVGTDEGTFGVHFNVLGRNKSPKDSGVGIDPGQISILIIHGFMDTAGSPENGFTPATWMMSIAEAIRSGSGIENGASANIILVDWSAGAGDSLGSYFKTLRNVQPVGEAIAAYLASNNIDPSSTILIGHSLGGHIAGVAGKQIKASRSGEMLRAIFGIDEAGIGYQTAGVDKMLDASDATKVISLKTSAWCGSQRHLASCSLFINPIRNESGKIAGYKHPKIPPTFVDFRKLNTAADRQSHLYGCEVVMPRLLRGGKIVAQSSSDSRCIKQLLDSAKGKLDLSTSAEWSGEGSQL